MKSSGVRERGKFRIEFDAGDSQSDGADCCEVKIDGLHLFITAPPKSSAPPELRPLGIEFHEPTSLEPKWQAFRTAVGELLGFVFGRHLIPLGWTTYDKSGDLIEAFACQPWGQDLEVITRRGAFPPIPLHEKGWPVGSISGAELGRLLGENLSKWLDAWNRFAIHDALWILWVARRLPLGSNLPILSSGIDALVNSWHASKSSKSGGLFLPNDHYKRLIGEGRELIAKNLQGHPHCQRILDKIDGGNQMGTTAKMVNFFDELRLPLSEAEKNALKSRHSMAHGGHADDDQLDSLHLNSRLYETTYHRVLLKLMGFGGEYLDYSVLGWPARALDTPASG